jgi:hypothetical protein
MTESMAGGKASEFTWEQKIEIVVDLSGDHRYRLKRTEDALC